MKNLYNLKTNESRGSQYFAFIEMEVFLSNLVNTSWTKEQLTQMLYHGVIGTIADNVIEIGWVLCFSLLSDKHMVERITTMFGLNDAFWIILSATYYTTRTALTARLPKLIEQYGLSEESKQFKNHVYLFYIMLLPALIGSWMFLPKLLLILGVSQVDLPLYIPYFRLTLISIGIAAPWATMIPTYLRTRQQTKIATILDHAIAWSMLIGIFISTHLFGKGVLWAMVINIFANLIPLFWFILNRPIQNFWSKGFEFSLEEIKQSWKIVKWELLRRLAPRIAAIIGASIMMTINPIFIAIKYWIANIAMFPEGWVDAMANLLNSHVSKNAGIKIKTNSDLIPYKDNQFVFRKALFGLILTIIAIYIIVVLSGSFLPQNIYKGITNPIIYVLMFIESSTKLRYYMWLSISRSYRHDLNGIAQLLYAIPTAFLTPLLLWLFLIKLNVGLLGIFFTGAIVGTVQWLPNEIYFKQKLEN